MLAPARVDALMTTRFVRPDSRVACVARSLGRANGAGSRRHAAAKLPIGQYVASWLQAIALP
jgi:hypothetical protein